MDRFASAVRTYVLGQYNNSEPVDPKKIHVHYVESWRDYRLYEYWIDGLSVDPHFPPVYIMLNRNFEIRWMTDNEAREYQEYQSELLVQGINMLGRFINKK